MAYQAREEFRILHGEQFDWNIDVGSMQSPYAVAKEADFDESRIVDAATDWEDTGYVESFGVENFLHELFRFEDVDSDAFAAHYFQSETAQFRVYPGGEILSDKAEWKLRDGPYLEFYVMGEGEGAIEQFELEEELENAFDVAIAKLAQEQGDSMPGPAGLADAMLEAIEEDLAIGLGAGYDGHECESVLNWPYAPAFMKLLRLHDAKEIDLEDRHEPLEAVASHFYGSLSADKKKAMPYFWQYVKDGNIPNVLCGLSWGLGFHGQRAEEFGLVFVDALLEAWS